MPLLMVALGVILLIVLITGFKVNAFISLIIVSFVVALTLGMPLGEIANSVETGLGGTLGHIALILGFGAMIGRLIADAGGAYRISMTLIDKFGKRNVQWAVAVASFIVGISLFWDVAFILLIPIVYMISKELKISITHFGLTMAGALVVAHSFLPPHPGITAVTEEYGADIAMVLVYGIIIAIPTIIIAGVWFPKINRRWIPSAFEKTGNKEALGEQKQWKLEETPGFGVSVLTAIFPILLMSASAFLDIFQKKLGFADNLLIEMIRFVGDAPIALLFSLLLALYTMGISRKIPMKELMNSAGASINAIGLLILITGGGGAFKQVIIDGGVGDYIAGLFADVSISPILLSWIIAVILRISLGSGTVAALSTAGLVLPMLSSYPDANLALVALATGAGTAFASHVNDPGFWMVKEFFGLSMKETFATYTILSSVASIVGIILVLLMDASVLLAGVAIAAIIGAAVIIHINEGLRNNKKPIKKVSA
ncbi:gluconate:H+ symporter [Oceanobacillus senegalensis]|uniref:gluconate:H+ symporter n=1 Tax=Oceanobacillus senegalensis TaxID=1936063 RepID=UPI000A30E968